MEFEKQIQQALRVEVDQMVDNEKMKQNVLKNIPYKKRDVPMKKRVMAVMIAIGIMVPTAGFAGYSYLADHIFDSKANFLSQGGTSAEYEQIEAKLKEAKKVLNQQEYEQMERLLREVAHYHKKMIEGSGKLDPNQLSAAERERYEQLEKELAPYSEKMMQVDAAQQDLRLLTLEESQKLLKFPVHTPTYVPQGYKFSNAVGAASVKDKNEKPTINMYYEKEGVGLSIFENEMQDAEQLGLSNEYTKTEEYTLNGYRALFGVGKDKEKTLFVVIPKQGNHSMYGIHVSGVISKEELEKVALSMIQP